MKPLISSSRQGSLFLTFLCSLLWAGNMIAFGQEVAPDTLEIHPLTIIALRPTAREAESLHLDHLGYMAHDGGALLNQITAISSIRKSGAYGFDPVFRGFKFDQLNVVLDGVQSASAACPNRMDPPTSQMAPNMIKKIELLKGPHALRYGNSFGGTIHFLTDSPHFSEKGEAYGRLSGGYESNGQVLRSEGLAGYRTARSDLGLFGAWSQGQDYHNGEGQVIPASFQRGSFGLQAAMKLNENQLLKISATRNLARNADFAALPMDLREDDTWLVNLNHKIYFPKGSLKSWNSSLYGSFVNHLMDNLDKDLNPRMADAITQAQTSNIGGRTEGTWKYNRSSLYGGADFRIEGAEGERTREFLMGPHAGNILRDNVWQGGQIQRVAAFSEYQLLALGMRWVISGRVELNSAQAKDPDPDFAGLYAELSSLQLNPGISVGGSRKFRDHLTLGLWLGRVRRSGSLTERFINYFPVGQDPYEMLGNPQIKPEINNEIDLKIQWESASTILYADLYAAYMQDYISSFIDPGLQPRMPTSPGVRRYNNLSQAMKAGFEAGWNQKLWTGLKFQFSMAYTYGQDLEREEPLPEIAPLDLRLQLLGSWLQRRLNPYLSIRHVIEQKRISTEFGETVTPAFTLVDLGLSFQITRNIGLSGGIQNLLNTLYYEHLSRSVRGVASMPIYAPGRSFFLSFNLDFLSLKR
jgi:iron complex outermembrane receptor protein